MTDPKPDCRRVPLSPRPAPAPGAADRARIAALAADIRAAEPAIADTAAFGAGVGAGIGPGPAILFGDSGEIPLLAALRRTRFDYRIGWLACPGDLVVTGGPESPDFETYQRRVLGGGEIAYLNVDPDGARSRRATPAICLNDPAAFARCLDLVRAGGGATLIAHLTTGTVWALAARLAAESGCRVHVAGPPPRLGRRVNDKLWFGAVCAALLGAGSVPPKRAAHSLSAVTRHVSELAPRCARLVVKVPDSAGSAGNLLLETGALRGLGPLALAARLREMLWPFGDGPRYPVAVELWEANVLSSPSAQVWVPPADEGPPVVEGLYDQVLSGPARAFAGAARARLPRRLDAALAGGALRLGLLFQALGYVGRCSFDAVVTGPRPAEAALHWIECNGRWGGVSVPMTLANRLAPPGSPRAAHVIVQDRGFRAPPCPFSRTLDRLGAMAAPRADGPPDVVLLSPGMTEAGSGCHLVAFGAGPAEAAASAAAARAALAGPG